MEEEASVLVMMSTQTWLAFAITGLSLVVFVVTLLRGPRRAEIEPSRAARVFYVVAIVGGLLLVILAVMLAVWLMST